ncbi:hypothetical protein ACFQVC_32795 [Streptomyces monticola]|uniref:Uncharacterized protein n=1 Tax=Streptomyces monticola TaxID=2666263 RepID=A0ABW2JT71_9ACTN
MTPPHTSNAPGPAFVGRLAAATGIHRADAYAVAQLFITHPRPRGPKETRDTVEDGMRRLAASLGLGPGDQAPPVIGSRITIRLGLAVLDYGHDWYVMTVPAPARPWLDLLVAGAPCRVCLTLAPLPITATRAETDAHLTDCYDHGLIRWGTTYARQSL